MHKKNFRTGFSYIELVFAMAIVVILMAVSAPFLTKKNYSQTGTSYGEYQCWTAYVDGDWKLFERSRYNTSEFDNPEGLEVDECTFIKPVGVSDFEVTLVSGGGGGSMANFRNPDAGEDILSGGSISSIIGLDDRKAEVVGDYQIIDRKYYLNVEPGVGGEPGNVITFKTILKSFDDDNEIKIHICETDYDTSLDIKKKANSQCVGKGGDGATSSIITNYRGTSKQKFYDLLKVYDDAIFDSGEHDNPYFGTGNGTYPDGDDSRILGSYYLPINSSAERIKDELDACKNDTAGDHNTGSMGDYTHFVTGVNTENNEFCTAGNCIVPGGKYGESSGNYERMTISNENQCESKGGKYYCFGSYFRTQNDATWGKHNNKVASDDNPIVEIRKKSNNSPYIDASPYNGAESLILNSTLKEFYEISKKDFGTGGGGGGFTMLTSVNNMSCKCARNKDIQNSTCLGRPERDSIADDYVKNAVSCDGSREIFEGKIALKRTNGGRGNGGAIIIKW